MNFANVPPANSVPFSSFPPSSDYKSLPTVAFVIPNLGNDMHDGSVAQGDAWLNNNLSAYAAWAKANNSLLVVTWDEDDNGENNQIPTIFYGANVKTGAYSEPVTHYNVLSTLEQMYGLNTTGNAGPSGHYRYLGPLRVFENRDGRRVRRGEPKKLAPGWVGDYQVPAQTRSPQCHHRRSRHARRARPTRRADMVARCTRRR